MKGATAHVGPGGPALSLAVLLGLCCVAPAALATGPKVPLPAPYYSFDLESPSVIAGYVGAADILEYGFPHPAVVVYACQLELFSPLDDLDGLSPSHLFTPPGQTFALLFSVDRQSVGMLDVDSYLLSQGIPFNVKDQAWRGQAGGDEFMSLELFGTTGPKGGLPVTNNTLVRNNFDEGGTSFSADPNSTAQNNASGQDQDNTDAGAVMEAKAGGRPIVNVYFSVTRESPSLATLPGSAFPSGAHIFLNPDPLGGLSTLLWAAYYELGLEQDDDIDAMIVFETNANPHFDGQDRVLFSLDPESPTLALMPGSSAADVFLARPGQPIEVFANFTTLGLDPLDNLDLLDFFLCNDAYAAAVQHGIQSFRGDMNCDNVLDFGDIIPFVLALDGQTAYMAEFPYCNWYNADCNCDGIVDYNDVNPFVSCLSDACPCP